MAAAAPPDINGNWANLTTIVIQFLQHPTRADAHVAFNNTYATELDDIDNLFTSPAHTTLRGNAVNLLRQKIIEVITARATQTADPTRITPIVNSWTFHYRRGADGNRDIRTAANLARQMTHALTPAGSDEIRIDINFATTFFDERPASLTYLDFQYMGTIAFPAPPAGGPAGGHPGGHGGGLGGPPPPPPPLAAAPPIFNPAALPADVRDRYTNWTNQHHLLRRNELVPFVLPTGGTQRYHLDPALNPQRLFLLDGTLIDLTIDINQKQLLKNPPYCTDLSPLGIRTWYRQLVRHCLSSGYFALPYFLFRSTHGGLQGFTCGDAANDDIPLRFQIRINTWSHGLHLLLSTPGMFPPNSTPLAILQQQPCGYTALKNIIMNKHPVFDPTPGTMVKYPPTQQRYQSLSQFFLVYEDFLRLRAFFNNNLVAILP